MRNFLKIAEGVQTMPVLIALAANEWLWNGNPIRTSFAGSPHVQVDDILVRFQDDKLAKEAILDEHESINYPAMFLLPQIRPLIFNLMNVCQAERLGRVIVTRLGPGKAITKHIDSGEHAKYYSRYQVMLQCLPGVVFNAGEESVFMQTGDVWWFDNSQEHEVINNSADDRIALIIDMRLSR